MSATHGIGTPATDCRCDHDCTCDPPRPLERNLFFPRKLMEVRHWRAEQAYHRRAREIVTRLGLGSGVLCGLEVTLTDDGTLIVGHGVAVDGHGRVVVVPRDVEVDPARLTDACGRPGEEHLRTGIVTVSLCLHECGTDPVALPPEGCAEDPRCVPSMVRESFAVTVTEGATERVGIPDKVCNALIGHVDEEEPYTEHDDGEYDEEDEDEHPAREDLRLLLDDLDPRSCACAEACVPLATVELDDDDGIVVDTSVRSVIRSNRQLLDLILCLAERVEECCHPPQVVQPPRITDLWPRPDDLDEALKAFAESHRIELAFDRDLGEQGLDDPMAWLGVWVLDPEHGATRLSLARAAGALDHVALPPGGDGAAYTVELREEMLPPGACVVVMARSTSPGPVQAAATDHLALDPDLAATGLSREQRQRLWEVEPFTTDGGAASFAADAVNAPLLTLPTGNGFAGGELHVVLRAREQVALPPQLLAVWPPGATAWEYENMDEDELHQWRSFIDQPRVELFISRALSDDALAAPKDWLRVWNFDQDGETLYSAREIELEAGEVVTENDGGAHYRFPMVRPEFMSRVFLVQLRSTPPVHQRSPVGRDDPVVLLDADFAGTGIDSQTLYRLWARELFPDGLPAFLPLATDGQTLHDGTPGGLVHWGMFIHQP
ncbi:hypothetical protein [Ornithinimicrobium pekingense]|uniref:Uncharacterized protein n=1 Tax=Ornithinimicrobium pekingense TaxID=384677 RepID=A0ABQ2F8A8_9MICO|nr:hypothetical protein [Ornithinimicrobium pekingense]GGK63501.1 hypothetical protein GCM10011509_09890 [Ornithinimicrobium pekingense]